MPSVGFIKQYFHSLNKKRVCYIPEYMKEKKQIYDVFQKPEDKLFSLIMKE